MPDRTARLAALRARVRSLEGFADGGAHGRSPFGLPALDAALPDGGLPLACLHEIAGADMAEDGCGPATGFAAFAAARLSAQAGAAGKPNRVLWLTLEDTLYPPGLVRFGLTPDRLIVARAARPADLLWSLEEAARSGAVAAAVGETAALGPIESRRLQLAAETGGVALLLLHAAPDKAGGSQPGTAVTRWRVGAAASRTARGEPGVGAECWRLDLVRCRGGRPGSWIVAPDGPDGTLVLAEPPDWAGEGDGAAAPAMPAPDAPARGRAA